MSDSSRRPYTPPAITNLDAHAHAVMLLEHMKIIATSEVEQWEREHPEHPRGSDEHMDGTLPIIARVVAEADLRALAPLASTRFYEYRNVQYETVRDVFKESIDNWLWREAQGLPENMYQADGAST